MGGAVPKGWAARVAKATEQVKATEKIAGKPTKGKAKGKGKR